MAKENSTVPAKGKTDAVAKTAIEVSPAKRFTEMVMRKFTESVGNVALTKFQTRLVQNYFIATDLALRTAEEKRMKKSESYRDKVAVTWQNVNMEALAVNVVSCARIGYDPALPNHISMVPFKNNTLQKYDIVFIPGYRGKEILAKKYGFDIPSDIVIEVVYSSDVFKPIKKDKNNSVETYIFEVKDPFNRGEIVGGFYYHVWADKMEKNKLMFYSMTEILKRKPDHASAEFWGGERAVYEDDEKTGKRKKTGTEKVEGWLPEMVYKTIARAAYSAISIDSQKIDDDFIKLSEHERIAALPADTQPGANSELVDFTEVQDVTNEKQGEIPPGEPAATETTVPDTHGTPPAVTAVPEKLDLTGAGTVDNAMAEKIKAEKAKSGAAPAKDLFQADNKGGIDPETGF